MYALKMCGWMAESAKSVCIVTQEFVEHEFSVVNINNLEMFHFEHIHDKALKTQFVSPLQTSEPYALVSGKKVSISSKGP